MLYITQNYQSLMLSLPGSECLIATNII